MKIFNDTTTLESSVLILFVKRTLLLILCFGVMIGMFFTAIMIYYEKLKWLKMVYFAGGIVLLCGIVGFFYWYLTTKVLPELLRRKPS